MSVKQVTDFAFAGQGIATIGKDSLIPLDLGNIERFINSVESQRLRAHLDDINQAIAQAGMTNNKIEWWCFNAATRNPLASRFIYLMLAFRCCVEKIEEAPKESTIVLENVPDTVKIAIARQFGKRISLFDRIAIFSRNLANTAGGIARLTALLFQAWRVSSRHPAKQLPPGSIGLFTFVDGSARHNGDPYFGNLAELLGDELPGTAVEHLAYVYRPYAKRIDEGEIDLSTNYSLLLSYLSWPDYLAAWCKFIGMSLVTRVPELPEAPQCDRAFSTILRDTLRTEISRGAIENYLIYKAFFKIGKSGIFSRIIYPFENKALEKCLLTGLAGSTAVKTTGYQHSSITKRHYAMQLVAGEFVNTPMPDRIITVGEVTRHWLLEHGFPESKVRPGCSLRHKLDFSSNARKAGELPRILFALSSSRYELESTVAFMKTLKERRSDWELGLRCHPNFPSSLLDEHDRAWLKTGITEFTGSSLADNLEWADVLGYVSSTVALEALASGLPVIRLDIEALNPDPLLEPPPFFRECLTVEKFINAVEEFRALDREARTAAVNVARSYVRSYLKPYNDDVVKEFVN